MAGQVERVYQQVGDRVADRRHELGITQEEFAERLGCSRASVANIETGRERLLLHRLVNIAAALRMPPSKLLRGLIR